MTISYEEFEKVDFPSGAVVKVEPFPSAKKPAYKVWVDLCLAKPSRLCIKN